MSQLYQLVNVFYKENEAQGNEAAVVSNQNSQQAQNIKEQEKISEKFYQQHGIKTVCFISEKDKQNYHVNCFNENNLIQCCGHGLIAAAKVIFNENMFSSMIINNNIKASQHENNIVLALPRLSAKMIEIPEWIEKATVFDGEIVQPMNAAISEQEDGYLLLEYTSQVPLSHFKAINFDSKMVCDSTKRAIVIVLFDEKNKHLYLRYFAPQYGVAEDTATGSVMRFVGDYIENKYQSSHFKVSQCSALGGFMMVESKEQSILITANVRLGVA